MKCYMQIKTSHMVQEYYLTASRDAGQRARQLRKAGYEVEVEQLGLRLFPLGVRTRLTLLTILLGEQKDFSQFPPVNFYQALPPLLPPLRRPPRSKRKKTLEG